MADDLDLPEERRTGDSLERYCRCMAEPRPARPRTKAEWLKRRDEVRAGTLTALGLSPMPDRIPLEPQSAGVLEQDGYRVERLTWQTWPGVRATGWLYLPADDAVRRPAVLVLPPAGADAVTREDTRQLLSGLARLGYTALAVDPAELVDWSTGVTPLTVATVANLRALDLLQSRSDVDRDRLGAIGAAEGGQQLIYLMAVDDRIRAGVNAFSLSYYREVLASPQRESPWLQVPGILRFTDQPELCAVGSPRAMLYLSGADSPTPIPTPGPMPEELGELLALYRLWQQPDRLAHRWIGSSQLTRDAREAAYTWLQRELKGDRAATHVDEPEGPAEDLEALRALAPAEGDRGADRIREWLAKRVVAQPPQLEGKPARKSYQDRVRAELTELLGGEPEPAALDTEWESEPGTPGRVTFRTERDVRIPALWLPSQAESAPVLVALHPYGKEDAVRLPAVRALQAAGYAVLAPDLRLQGELEREWLPETVLWGRPEAGMAAHDLRACVDWLYQRGGIEPRSLVVLGAGDRGVVALLAATLDERITATVADCLETTYRDGGPGLPVIPNILRSADVPQVASLIAPRPLWLYQVPEDRVGFSSRRYYDWTRRTYQSLGEPDALKMSTGSLPEASTLVEWLERRIRRARR